MCRRVHQLYLHFIGYVTLSSTYGRLPTSVFQAEQMDQRSDLQGVRHSKKVLPESEFILTGTI